MRLSEDRISFIAHLLCESAVQQGFVKTSDRGRLLAETKQILQSYCHLDDEVDDIVRKKLGTYSRNIMEGSPEWDVMYKKHFQEEMQKKWK